MKRLRMHIALENEKPADTDAPKEVTETAPVEAAPAPAATDAPAVVAEAPMETPATTEPAPAAAEVPAEAPVPAAPADASVVTDETAVPAAAETPDTTVSQDTADEESSDTDVAQNIEEIQDMVNEADAVSEATSALASTEVIEERLEEKVKDGVGMENHTALMVGSALEHFYERAGFSESKMSGFSLENFNEADRLENTKVALEELKEFNTGLRKSLTIAQEGLSARFINTVKMVFNSEEDIKERIMAGMAKAKDGKVQDVKVLKTPGWGRSFAVIGKKELSYDDVASYLKRYSDLITSSELNTLMNDFAACINKVGAELTKSRFIADDAAIAEIHKIATGIEEFHNRCAALSEKHNVKTASNDPSFNSLTAEEVAKLGATTLKLMDDSKYKATMKKFTDAIDSYNTNVFLESHTRLAKAAAKDIRAADQVINHLNSSFSNIYEDIGEFHRITFAVSNYIKASVK